MSTGVPESDEDLACRARRGDRHAFDVLIGRHKEMLYAFVRRYVGSADDGYDILQDTFVAAWLGLSRYDPARPFLPWIRTIALNKCRDFGRRRSVRRLVMRAFARENVDELTTNPADSGEDADQVLADRLSRLDRAIADLPALYKEPLLLTMVSGLSHKEAAEMLKTTPKAVEMRLARARHSLGETLKTESWGGIGTRRA